MKKTYKRALTIAGSDCSGGAGIQADLKTFSALGCYGMSVVTALTAQNTKGVYAIHDVPIPFVLAQLDAVIEDIGVDSIKIGMLHSSSLIEAIAKSLNAIKCSRVVLDPVMIAKNGACLLEKDAVTVLRDGLLPIAQLITPNIPEAEALLGIRIESKDDVEKAAMRLVDLGAKSVVIKGGHFSGENSPDFLYHEEEGHWIGGVRIATVNTHGTGCTFSAAIASFLASGSSIPEAVSMAKQYIQVAIEHGATYECGSGHGPVHHFHRWWS